jgi:hypothetical protein
MIERKFESQLSPPRATKGHGERPRDPDVAGSPLCGDFSTGSEESGHPILCENQRKHPGNWRCDLGRSLPVHDSRVRSRRELPLARPDHPTGQFDDSLSDHYSRIEWPRA